MIIALAVTTTLQMIIIYLPFFNDVFKTKPLSWQELAITAALSSIVFWAVELEKFIRRKWFTR
jgi:Ca2+-transporting ATPase